MEIKLKDLKAHDNYRKTFDKGALAELTASVKERGVLQPVIVRKNGRGGKYLIIAGHRRVQAAREAGLKTVPAVIKAATDEEALEISLIENDQREDPNPMEQAIAYKTLLDKGNHTPETLAAKLDRSVGYVLGRLKLVGLPERVQKKILSGDIPVSHALLLTRLKNRADILEAAKRFADEDLTLNRAKEMVQSRYSIKLDNVPFDRTDCKKCPACAKNQTALFPEAKSRFECFDLDCCHNKLRAYFEAWLTEKKEAGFTILTDEDMGPLLHNYNGRSVKGRYAFPEPGDWRYPKKHKSMCAKCEDRGYYVETRPFYSGGRETQQFKGVEVCLKGSCYDKMMGNKPDSKTAPAGKDNSYAPMQHARLQRDRFLRAKLADKVTVDNTPAIRLAIYHLVKSLGSEYGRFDFEKFTKWLSETYGFPRLPYTFSPDEKFYLLLSQVPGQDLDRVFNKALADAVAVTKPEVLLQMCEESGVNPKAEIIPDEVYLRTKTKGDLLALAPVFGVTLDAKMKKGEMLDLVLKADLTGKLTAELDAVLNPLEISELQKDAEEHAIFENGENGENGEEDEDEKAV